MTHAGLKVAQTNANQKDRSRDASRLEKQAQKNDWKAMVRLGQVRLCTKNTLILTCYNLEGLILCAAVIRCTKVNVRARRTTSTTTAGLSSVVQGAHGLSPSLSAPQFTTAHSMNDITDESDRPNGIVSVDTKRLALVYSFTGHFRGPFVFIFLLMDSFVRCACIRMFSIRCAGSFCFVFMSDVCAFDRIRACIHRMGIASSESDRLQSTTQWRVRVR
jgi:hypothetical protein